MVEKRKAFLEEFIPIFNKRYADITKNKEQVDISYKSQLFDSDLASLLEANLQKDMALQYTSVGTHKDDLSFEIEGHPIGATKIFFGSLKVGAIRFY